MTYQKLPTWARPSEPEELYVYYTPASLEESDAQIAQHAAQLAADGATGIIPRLAPAVDAYIAQHKVEVNTAVDKQQEQRQAQAALERTQDEAVLAFYRRVYKVLVRQACACGLKIAFHPEKPLERMVVRAAADMRAYMLTRREYYLSQEQHVELTLSDTENRVATVAVDLRDGDTKDLLQTITDGRVLPWDVPTGNWCVQEFVCQADPEANANYLNYEASRACLQACYALLSDLFVTEESALGVLYLDDIGFHAPNHRNWSPEFNTVFAQLHGCDPAPWYPHLYEFEDHQTQHIKALMQHTRAHMLRQGIYRALADVAAELGVPLLCSGLELKLAAPSAISGDALANQAVAPGAVLNRAYAYGLHSLKIAAAGEVNYGQTRVTCELCRDYAKSTADILYRETMHALVRGCNVLLAHTEGADASAERAAYLGFARRASAILRRGKSVSDIAVLYPACALHASVSFYESTVHGFEYPGMPSFADYTSLVQALISCTGRDVTLLHPDVLREHGQVKDGQLLLATPTSEARFDVLVLPAASMLTPQLAELIKNFYEGGGKIIATGELLPHKAFCRQAMQADESADEQVAACMSAIFGQDPLDPAVVASTVCRENAQGGQAIWLYPWQTAIDGGMIVDSDEVVRAMDGFSVSPDVEVPTLPRYRECGILGLSYPEFSALHLLCVLPGNGVLEYIHKRCSAGEMYYFVNTRDRAFSGDVFLRGEHPTLTLYDPMCEQTWEVSGEIVQRHGRSYTRLTMQLPAVSSLFVFS